MLITPFGIDQKQDKRDRMMEEKEKRQWAGRRMKDLTHVKRKENCRTERMERMEQFKTEVISMKVKTL